jgi:serine/threonine protein kinase
MTDEIIDHSSLPSPLATVPGIGIGTILADRYEIVALLGSGGMGVAYKARDLRSGQFVALKFLSPDRLTNPKDILRFKREAATASKLQHVGIAHVVDFGLLEDSQPYLAMEYVAGTTLAQRIESTGQLPWEETLDVFIQVCDALAYAHSKHVLHRDIKPSNIMVSQSPGHLVSAKLLDFGIARLMQSSELTRQRLTGTGEVLGSPVYMSPEQARSAELDARSDLYSVGCSLYEALTGSPPHLGQTPIATILKRETDQPLALSEASLGLSFPQSLETVVFKLLETKPNDRIQSAPDLKEKLQKIRTESGQIQSSPKPITHLEQPSRPSRSLWIGPVCALLVLCAATTALSYLFLRPDSATSVPKRMNSTISTPISTPTPSTPPIPEFEALKADGLLSAGDHALQRRDYARAYESYSKANALFVANSRPLTMERRDALLGMAYCAQELREYDKAAELELQVIEIDRKRIGDTPAWAFELTFMGSKFLQQTDVDAKVAWQRAEPLYKKSVVLAERIRDQRVLAYISQQVQSCVARHLIREAQLCFDQAQVCLKVARPEDRANLLPAMSKMASIYNDTYHYEKIEPLAEQALSFYQTSPPSQRFAFVDNVIAIASLCNDVAARTKQPLKHCATANLLCQAVLPICQRPSDDLQRLRLAALYHLMGHNFHMEGNFGKASAYGPAMECLQKSYQVRCQIEKRESAELASTVVSIAQLYRISGNYREAVVHFKHALDIFEKTGDTQSRGCAEALDGVATCYRMLGRIAEADALDRRSFEILAKTGGLETILGVGLLLRQGAEKERAGQYVQAIKLYEQAQRICRTRFPGCVSLNAALERALAEVKGRTADKRSTSIDPVKAPSRHG